MSEATTSSAIIDLTRDEPRLLTSAEPLPLGRRAQLRVLQQQLEWCDAAVRAAQRDAARAMRDQDLTEDQRWGAVRQLRGLAWKVCREVLPLVGRVPASLRSHPHFREVERAAHDLRRTTEDALRDNANYTVDLVTPNPW